MPLITAAIGLATQAIEHLVDARWTMAYSAALGDSDPIFLDTTRPAGIVSHPLFAICPEWPVALASRDLLRQRGLTADEFRRGVHATHDSHIYRLIRPGDRLSTRATILDIEVKRPGAYVTTCFDTHDQHGVLVCRTFSGMLLRDVELMSVNKAPIANLETGIDIPKTPFEAAALSKTVATRLALPVAANFAHVYTECARIWNPIHTDEAVARGAGLPHIILHGSATLALAVSAIMRRYGDADPNRVRRICGQFRGMVLLPSSLNLICFQPSEGGAETIVPFEVHNDSGEVIVRHGSLSLTD